MKRPRLFLAHAKEDKPLVRQLYARLKAEGLNPWLDEEDLLPGQNWPVAIPKAIRECDYFIACLSEQAIRKQGYVQKEFRMALDLYAEKPPESIFLIPLKFDDCQVPSIQLPHLGVDLRDIHWIDYWKPNGFERLLKAIGITGKENTVADAEPSEAVLTMQAIKAKNIAVVGDYAHISGGQHFNEHHQKTDVIFDQQGQEVRYQVNIGNLSFGEPSRPQSISPESLAEAEARFRQRIKETFGPDAPYYIPLASTTSEMVAAPADDSCGARSRRRQRMRTEYCEWIGEAGAIRKIELPDLGTGVAKYPCIILLGDPGCGKTTALQNLAFESADNPQQLPLLLSLSQFAPGMKIEDFIRLGWAGRASAGHWAAPEPASNLEQYLQDGRLFLLFDALNECPRKAYDQCAGDLRRFIDQWTPNGNRFVVSCRVLDYGEELSGLQRIEIQPFSDAKIEALLQRELPKTWPELWKRLTEADQRERSLLTLARNPYILTMIIDVFDKQGRLGENRAQMLQLFTQTLFAWAKKKCDPDQWIDAAVQQEALAHLAFESQHRQGSGAAVPIILAQAVLPAEVQLDPAWPAISYPKDWGLELAAKARIVEMPVDRSSVKFYHQLLQEYFAARRLLRRPPQELAGKWRWPWLEQEMPLWNRPEDNYDPLPPPPPTGWEETTILAAGLAPQNDDQLVRALVAINPVLAGRSLHEGRARVSRDTFQMAIDGLLKTIADPAVALRVRIAAGKVLGYLGDPRIGEMVEIGAGEFYMGDDDDDNASPRHPLFLPDYQMGKYPVTNSEFSRFMDAGGYAQKRWWGKAGWAFRRNKKRECPDFWDDDRFNAPNQPVVGIGWFEALAYCRWLASATGTPYELPSEAQWEKAARGIDGWIYPWGNAFEPESANCYEGEQIVQSTTPVGIYPTGISPFGCLDMAGNVWEWTRSLWGRNEDEPEFKYPYNPDDGREDTDAEDELLRVLRGGSWLINRDLARCSSRSRLRPNYRVDRRGFRVAVSPIISALWYSGMGRSYPHKLQLYLLSHDHRN